MNINEMHYDFKLKFNKIDSQQNRNFQVPEIDWILREAEGLFIKMIAMPRKTSFLGFEKSQRSIDDIRSIVKDSSISVTNTNEIELPVDYWHYLRGSVLATKGSCANAKLKLHIQEHDDDFENDSFTNTSFNWREVNGLFKGNIIKLEEEVNVSFTSANISYIKYPLVMHNAEKFKGGSYTNLKGEVLVGSQSCELPEQTHTEIVDIAVLIASGVVSSDYQALKEKLGFNLN